MALLCFEPEQLIRTMEPYIVDNNTIKWSGFYNSEEEAQKSLEDRLEHISKRKNIVSAKKELIVKDNSLVFKLKDIQKTVRAKKMLLYKFTVIVAVKE